METGVVSAVEDTAVMKREMAETATDIATMRHVAKVMRLGLRFSFLRWAWEALTRAKRSDHEIWRAGGEQVPTIAWRGSAAVKTASEISFPTFAHLCDASLESFTLEKLHLAVVAMSRATACETSDRAQGI